MDREGGKDQDKSGRAAVPKGGATGAEARADRLKAALKANMARRKTQAKARAATAADDVPGTGRDGQQDATETGA